MLQLLLNMRDSVYLENYVRIVAFAIALRKLPFCIVRGILQHIKLKRLLKSHKRPYQRPKVPQKFREVIVSSVAAVRCRFMPGRQANQYFQSKDTNSARLTYLGNECGEITLMH